MQLNARPDPRVAHSGILAAAKQAGYRTLAVSTNFWASPLHHRTEASVSKNAYGELYLLDQEIPHYFPAIGPVLYPHFDSYLRFLNGAERFDTRGSGNDGYSPERAFRKARELLPERSDTSPFLWVHLFPPHSPYAAPAPFLTTFEPGPLARTTKDSTPPYGFPAGQRSDFPGSYSGRYDEAVRYVDHATGAFLDWLREQGLFENALIIITADHGESFTHGYGGHGGPMLYEDLIRVPLLIKLPHQHEGRRVGVLTEHADLLPTLLEYFQLPVPGHVEGRSLKPILDGMAVDSREVYAMNFEENSVFAPLETGSLAMLEGRYKYVRYLGALQYPMIPRLEDALYDLETDPGEARNLVRALPERAAQMRGAIEAKRKLHGAPGQ